MKSFTAFALAIFSCVPAMAQFGGGAPGQPQAQAQRPAQSIESELLEIEQEVDKALLREALTLQGRQGLNTAHDEGAKRQLAEISATLRDFIDKKKEAIIARAGELRKSRVASARANVTTAATPAGGPNAVDRQAAAEKAASAQIETQLLEAQIELLKPALTKAIEALAAAELAASNDEAQRPTADAARKEYDRVKAKHVEYSKRLSLERQELLSMQRMSGMGGMGMGGMGGGFR